MKNLSKCKKISIFALNQLVTFNNFIIKYINRLYNNISNDEIIEEEEENLEAVLVEAEIARIIQLIHYKSKLGLFTYRTDFDSSIKELITSLNEVENK